MSIRKEAAGLMFIWIPQPSDRPILKQQDLPSSCYYLHCVSYRRDFPASHRYSYYGRAAHTLTPWSVLLRDAILLSVHRE
jgi:hypothetical protein